MKLHPAHILLSMLFASTSIAESPGNSLTHRIDELVSAAYIPRMIVAEAMLTKEGEFISERERCWAEDIFAQKADGESYTSVSVANNGLIQIEFKIGETDSHEFLISIEPKLNSAGNNLKYSCSLDQRALELLGSVQTSCNGAL